MFLNNVMLILVSVPFWEWVLYSQLASFVYSIQDSEYTLLNTEVNCFQPGGESDKFFIWQKALRSHLDTWVRMRIFLQGVVGADVIFFTDGLDGCYEYVYLLHKSLKEAFLCADIAGSVLFRMSATEKSVRETSCTLNALTRAKTFPTYIFLTVNKAKRLTYSRFVLNCQIQNNSLLNQF